MTALRKDLKSVESFIKQLKSHTQKLKLYSQMDPYIWEKYLKELSWLHKQTNDILENLNNHDSVLKLKDELRDAMDEFEKTLEDYKNDFI